MIKVTNKKNINVTFEDMILPALSSVTMGDEQWNTLYSKQAIRGCVELGYIEAEVVPENTKGKKTKKEDK